MEIVRFKANQEINYGVIKGKQIIKIAGDIFNDPQFVDDYYLLSEVELLAPTVPEKIVCVGLNYRDHAEELNLDLPEEPIIFLKPPTALLGPDKLIKYPESSEQVDYEAELAVIIKDEIKNISAAKAKQHILGYTCFNDVTARDLQNQDKQWTRAKSFDTFAPLGPKIVTDINPNDLDIKLLLNGEVKQRSNTSQMIFAIPEVISFISQVMTLRPGDVIATGTPPGIGEMKNGDQVTVEIENIGRLTNKIS